MLFQISWERFKDEMKEEDLSISRNNIEVDERGDMIALHLTSLRKNKEFVVIMEKDELSRVDRMNLAGVSKPSKWMAERVTLKNISKTLRNIEDNLNNIPRMENGSTSI